MAQARHLLRHVQFLAALGLDDPHRAIRAARDEVRRVGRKLAVRFHIIQLEAHGHVVFAEGLHVGRGVEERRKGQFQPVRPALAHDPVEHRTLRWQESARLGAERARVAQPDMAFDARAAAVVDGQRVDRSAEVVKQHLADFRLGQVAQDHRIVQIDRAREKVIAHERLDPRIELVIATHQMQVFQELAGEEADHGAVVRRAVAIELDGVVHLGIEHRLEDDLAGLFRREGLDGQLRVAERRGVELRQVFELAVKAAGEAWQGDVEFVDVLSGRFSIDLDDEGVLPFASPCPAHRHPFEGHAFALDRFDELHESRGANDRDGLALVAAEIHAAQAAPQRLLGQDVALGGIGPQTDDGGDVAHVPAFLEHQHRHNRLEGRLPGVDLVRLLAQNLEIFLVLARGRFGNLAVGLGVDHQHSALQLRANLLQVRAHLIAVLGVIHHHEQHGLLAQLLVLGVALAPFLHAQLQVVGVFLGDQGAFVFGEFGAAGRIRQHRMLDHVLGDCLDQRVVAHGLHEDRAVVVARRGRHVHLYRQPQVFLQQPMMNVLNALEPGQAVVVDVVRLVVEHGEFVNLAHDLAQVGFAVVGLADGLFAERRQEVVAQIVIVQRRLRHFAEIDAVNVGEEDVARRPDDAHVVLNVQCDLEIIAPVVAGVAVVGQHRIIEEDAQPVEISAEPVEHDDVGRDQQEVARQRGIRLVELVEVAPGHQQRQHLGLACAGGHLDHEARPVLVEHVARYRAGGIEAQQVELVAHASRVIQPDDGLDSLALGEVVAELDLCAVRLLEQVIRIEPPGQQRA